MIRKVIIRRRKIRIRMERIIIGIIIRDRRKGEG
jgi:hypothetical protein